MTILVSRSPFLPLQARPLFHLNLEVPADELEWIDVVSSAKSSDRLPGIPEKAMDFDQLNKIISDRVLYSLEMVLW